MKDLIDSIRLQVHERMSSPLFGSFVIAWLGWNYRMLVVVFSTLPVKERFEVIDHQLYATPWAAWSKGLFFPLASALVFILVYPYPSKWIYGYWQKRQKELKELRDKIEGDTMLTVEESRSIYLKVRETEIKYRETIRQQAEEIEGLRGTVNKKPDRLAKAVDDVTTTLGTSEGASEVIHLLAKQSGEIYLPKLYEMFSKTPQVRVQSYVDEVIQKHLVTITHRREHEFLSLTEKGRAFAVKAKFV